MTMDEKLAAGLSEQQLLTLRHYTACVHIIANIAKPGEDVLAICRHEAEWIAARNPGGEDAATLADRYSAILGVLLEGTGC